MKIFVVGTVPSTLFRIRSSLIKALVVRGHEVTVYANGWTDETRLRAQNELGVVCREHNLSRGGMNPFRDLLALAFLCREFRRHKPDCVYSYLAKPVIWGGLAAWITNVQHNVGMLEGLGYAFTQSNGSAVPVKKRFVKWLLIFLYRVAIPRLDRIIFLNPDDPVDLLESHGIRAREICVLGGIGVDLERLAYEEPPVAESTGAVTGQLRFIFIGRLLAEKGINEYVAAARKVKQHYPQAQFVVLGSLDEMNPGGVSASQLAALTEEQIIEHPGYVSDVEAWIARSDVFVLPSSYREGVPASTQEAMALGRAVITTDVPGCRETVVDGVNGFLIPPWDPDILAAKMIELIEEPQRVVEMGREGRRMAEQKFDVRKVAERWCEMLEGHVVDAAAGG